MKKLVNFSGGKDSTAMLLRLYELGHTPDAVFADTGFEFPELYEYIEKIEKYLGIKVKKLTPPENEWEKWYYGEWTRGRHKGEVRGFPKEFDPCYWSREAKVKPLENAAKDYDIVYVGIAFDETERMLKETGKIKYPLVDWRWTEQDCINYLNKKGLFNPLYVNFDRLGCWCCPKQGVKSLYVLWKVYPNLWKKFKDIEAENKELTGRTIKAECSLREFENDFEKGYVPKLPKYDCWNGCESVKKAFKYQQVRLCQ